MRISEFRKKARKRKLQKFIFIPYRHIWGGLKNTKKESVIGNYDELILKDGDTFVKIRLKDKVKGWPHRIPKILNILELTEIENITRGRKK